MTDRHVYLYKITLSKEGEDPLYYFGIRFGFDGLPEDDDYMGSPQTHKDLWEDSSYVKSKDILEIGTFSNQNELRNFANTEIQIIKDAWNKYGMYSKGGQCLNAQAGRVFIHTPEVRKEIARKQSEYWTGNPLHPMKRPEHRKRKSEEMKQFVKDHPDCSFMNSNNLPHIKEKNRERMLRDNPMHRPEVVAKVTGENNPMYGKKHSEEMKRQIAESTKKATNTPEYKKKQSEMSKKRWEDKEYRERMSATHKRRWEETKKDPEKMEKFRQSIPKDIGERIKKVYVDNPHLKERMMGDNNVSRRTEVRLKISESLKKKNRIKRELKNNSLENYFE